MKYAFFIYHYILMRNNQNPNSLNERLDFNRISDMPSKYPRLELP